MIASMQHATILFASNHRRRTIIRLREMGMLHIQQEHQSAEISTKVSTRLNTCRQALQIMRQYRKVKMERMRKSKRGQTRSRTNGVFLGEEDAQVTVNTFQELERLREEEQHLIRYKQDIKVWGSFRRQTIEDLQECGWHCHFYILTRKMFVQHRPPSATVIAHRRGRVYFVVVSRSEENELPYEEVQMPPYDLAQLQRWQKRILARRKKLEERLVHLARSPRPVWTAYQRLHDLNQIVNVRSSFESHGEVMSVRGFIPTECLDDLYAHAKKMHWGLSIRDPLAHENPPTILKNRRSIAIINPVYRMLGTIPGYREPDISVLFLFFFILFFVMIVGDAGYGLLLVLVALVYRLCTPKEKVAHRQGSALLLVVGLATLIWGAMSGNWFAIESLAEHPFFMRFIVKQLNVFDARSTPFIQWVCFLIAAVHISIAHFWRIIHQCRNGYWLQALSNIGWLCIVFGLYSLAVRLIVGIFGYWYMENALVFLIIGLFGIVLFAQQERGKSFLVGGVKGIVGLFNTILDSVSTFADIISYLRLFAVGLASVEIARSFNQLAASIDRGVFGVLLSVVLLCVGHSLNLAMGALSIIVHGVRLNMLEFSSHIGIEWSGIVYQPFKRHIL